MKNKNNSSLKLKGISKLQYSNISKSIETGSGEYNPQNSTELPKLKVRSLSPSSIPINESVYSKVKISDVFALEKLILPKFKF